MNSVLVPRGLMLSAAFLAAAPAAFAQAPVNDAFAAAQSVAPGAVTAGTNVNATVEASEPPTHWTLTYAAGVATGKSVWYKFTPVSSGLASFSVVAQGTGTAAAALQAAAYTGTSLGDLVRVASASSTAGAAGPPATAGAAFPSNLFAATAGTPVYIQVTGNSATGVTPFDLTVTPFPRPGTVVLQRNSNWEWLHSTTGVDPTAAPAWATTWKNPGDTSDYGTAPAVLKFNAAAPAPLGFAALDGAPGIKTVTTATAPTAANNNAAYARTTFTLAAATSNLWAEVMVDDGAYIYIDDLPGVPVNIAAALSNTSFTTSTGILNYRPQTDVFLTGAIPAASAAAPVPGCRAYAPAGLNVERNTKMVFLGGLTGVLAAGPHKIAVSLHQTNTGSSDMAFDLSLIDMGAWPLAQGDTGTNFTEVPFVAGSTTATVVPAVEYHYAPVAGAAASTLAWFSVSPAASPRQSTVVSDANSGAQKAFRFHETTNQKFVTEPVKVQGLTQFVASLRIMTHETSTTSDFEDLDGFRVFLETSADGITFAEPAPALELQPQVNGAAALDPFRDVWVTKALPVTANSHNYVRLVITGGVDSNTEWVHFDDIRFGQCQMFAATTAPVYNNNNTDTRVDDTVSFDLTVTGSGNAATTWTSSGFGAGSEVSGTIGGPAVSVTRPAADASGVRQNVVFSVSEDGNPACLANVTVTTPTAAIGTITLGTPIRNKGPNPDSTADDTFTFTVLVDGTAHGVNYEIRSSDTGNTVLYGAGVYNTAAPLTIPASVASITIKDVSVPTLLKAAAVPTIGAELAMGRTALGGVTRLLYNNPTATPSTSKWAQATGTEVTATDLELTVTDTTTVFRPPTALANADEGVMESPAVDVTGIPNVAVTATLRAFEDSTTTGFETTDTFKIEVIEERAGGNTTVNLITGNAADDSPANDLLNGYTGTTADPYNTDPAKDEFNTAGALVAAHSRGTFTFTRNLSADVLRVRVKVTAANDSGNEFFFLHSLFVTDAPVNPGLDSDGDGQTDASELVAGTDSQNPNSLLRISTGQLAGNQVNVTFDSVIGKKYIAQTSTDLINWTDTGAQVTATGTSTSIANLPITAGHDFYRVRVVP